MAFPGARTCLFVMMAQYAILLCEKVPEFKHFPIVIVFTGVGLKL